MASVFKRKYTKVVDGKRVKRQSACWHIKYRDAEGVERRAKGFKDKEATRQLAAKLEREAELGRAGVVDRCREHRARPLKEHLEDFRKSLLAKGNTIKHAELTFSRAKVVIEGCRFAKWGDISASNVEQFLAGLRNDGEGISAQTFNFYLQAAKQFCRWMVQDQRAAESPLRHLKGMNVRTDRRHDRISFEVDEVRRLLVATVSGPERYGMGGRERSLLYRTTVETGLRRRELRGLKVSSFDLDKYTVTVVAGYSKRRREDVLPLRPETAAELKVFFSGKLPTAKAFGGRYKQLTDKTALMIRADLAAADIDYVDHAGRYRDFHALRHTTGSWLVANGVNPKVAQSILRHSSIDLTMSRYSHTLRGQEAEAVAKLPDLSIPERQAQKATGTDGRPVGTRPGDSERLTPQLTPQLTPTVFTGRNELSVDDTRKEPETDKSENRKGMEGGGV